MIVSSYGYYHGQTSTTTNTLCAAISVALEYKMKILLTHSQYLKGSLESAFFDDQEKSNYIDTGIDVLEQLSKANKLNPEKIKNYTKEVIRDRLYVLTGTTKSDIRLFDNDKMLKAMVEIIYHSNSAFDLVFVDLNSGAHSELTKCIIDISDLVIINLNQNEKVLKDFFSSDEWKINLKDRNKLIVLGRYDPDSKYTTSYIRRIFDLKDEIYTIPYSTQLMDAHNDHNLLNHFVINSNLDKKDKQYYFMEEVNKLSSKIFNLIEYNNEIKKEPAYSKKQRFFTSLKTKIFNG